MSLIHQALKKAEKSSSGQDSQSEVTDTARKDPARKRRRTRISVLLICNLLAAGAVYWFWQQNTPSASTQPKSAAVVPTKPAAKVAGNPTAQKPTAAVDPLARLEEKAINLYRSGDFRGTLPLWEQLILRDSLNPEYYNNLGVVMKKLGRWEEAIEQYQKAIQLKPEYSTAYNNMGVLYLARGNSDEAQRNFDKATSLAPMEADPHLNLGYLFELRGDLSSARQSYQTFLEKLSNPNDPIRPQVEERLALVTSLSKESP